jgi:hypothetical protein
VSPRPTSFINGLTLCDTLICVKPASRAMRSAAQAGVERGPQALAQVAFVQRLNDFTVGADTLVRLDHARVQQLGQHDVAVEDARALLVADAQRVAKALGRDQQRRLALALEQRVGRDRRAHLHALDLRRRDRLIGPQPQQVADAGHRRVAVLLGVLAQQLVRDQRPVGPLADHVGEGAATVDPELPAVGNGGLLHERKPSR